MALAFNKDLQYYKFSLYGFLKNLQFFEPFLYLFFLEKGITFLQIGTLITIREISRNILEIPAGILADAFGRRRAMISAFVFYLISLLLFYFSSGYPIFVVAMLFYSFGDAFRTGTHKAMIFEYLKIKGWDNQKVHYYGHTRSASQFGSAISSILAGVIVFYSGNYSLIFLFTGIPYLLDLTLMITYPKELDGKRVRLEGKRIRENFRDVMWEVIYSFRQPALIKTISNISIFSGYYRAVKDYIQPILQVFAAGIALHLGIRGEKATAVLVGLIYFFIYILSAYTSRKSGSFAERFANLCRPLNISLVAGIGLGLVSGILFTGEAGIMVALGILVFVGIYLVENLRRPIGVAYVSEILSKDILATALSTESQVKSIYAALLAPLIGFLADQFGIGISLVIVSSIIILFFPLLLTGKKRNVA